MSNTSRLWKLLLPVLFVLLGVAVALWTSGRRPRSAEAFVRAFSDMQVIADEGHVKHNYPKGQAMIGHNTLFLKNPRVLRTGGPVPTAGVIVWSEGGDLARKLPLASQTTRSVGGSYAIRRTKVRLFQVTGTSVQLADSAGITYLRISE